MESSQPGRQRFHYAWVIFAAGFLSIFTALGFCSSPGSLYLAAITEDLGISRSLYSISSSCRFLTTAIVNLFFGRLVAKFGPRKLIAAGFSCLVAFALLNSFSANVLTFCLGGVLLGLGMAWTATAIMGTVVENWFTSEKGTVMGIILAANGLGGAVSAQILSPIIYGSPAGWRTSYRVTALILMVVGALIVAFMRNNPSDLGCTPLGSGSPVRQKKRGRDWIGITVQEAVQHPWFYVCALCVFLTGMISQSVSSVATAHMRDQGLNMTLIAASISVHSLCLMASKILTGISFDKFGLRVSMLICDVCMVSAIVLLAFVSNPTMAWAYQIISSFGLPLQTVILPLLATECFGHKSYAFLMGIMVSFNTLGFALGAPLINAIFDLTGTYTVVMAASAGILTIVAVVMQLVITAAHRERKQLEQSAS